MGAKRHERTHARRSAVQVLYQSEMLNKSVDELVAEGLCVEDEESLTEYAFLLIRGVEEHRIAIDNYLRETSENWTLERMPSVDRSILRLSTFEMAHVEDVPLSVSINEAVELAKDFGGEDDSPRFINGVLGRIAKILEEDNHDT